MARLLLAVGAAAAVLAAVAIAAPRPFKAAPTPPRGPIRYGSFHSAALRGTDNYAVYLPHGYAGSTRRYPVVYFLHGLPAGPTAYRGIGPIVDAVARSGDQAIVVGAEGSRSADTDPEWLDWRAGRAWETATATELVRAIDRRYRTIPERAGRLLVGISAGGYGATLIANHHPGTYAVVESWSGYFHPTDPTGTQPLDLGSPQANAWASFAAQIPHLKSRFGRWYQKTYFAFYVGSNDRRFRAENLEIDRALEANHVPHVRFRLYPGGHSWSLWRRHATAWVAAGLHFAAALR